MGYQLWVSPVTGYRRRGTRVSELRNLFESKITVSAILEPLRSCLTTDAASDVREQLETLDFDLAGVLEGPDSPVVGMVRREELHDGRVADFAQPINPGQLISSDTPLPEAFQVLRDNEAAFVLIRRDVAGIVTRADLYKPPSRIFVFGLVSLLEMHLTFWIRQSYKESEWRKKLNASSINRAKGHFQRRREHNEELELLDCLGFGEKLGLGVESNGIRGAFGIEDPDECKRVFSAIQEIRNLLAHSQESFAEGHGWRQFVDVITRLEGMLVCSDELIEQEAETLSESGTSPLAAFYTS